MSPTELTQVLINLVANGAQAVAARGGPHGRVSIEARTDDDMLELAVRDDGVGHAARRAQRASARRSSRRAPKAPASGLAQCQRLVGTAGGRLADRERARRRHDRDDRAAARGVAG